MSLILLWRCGSGGLENDLDHTGAQCLRAGTVPKKECRSQVLCGLCDKSKNGVRDEVRRAMLLYT